LCQKGEEIIIEAQLIDNQLFKMSRIKEGLNTVVIIYVDSTILVWKLSTGFSLEVKISMALHLILTLLPNERGTSFTLLSPDVVVSKDR